MTTYTTTELAGGCVKEVIRDAHHLDRTLKACESGVVTFEAPITSLYHKGDESDLWPWAVLELPVSMLRLARGLVDEFEPTHRGIILVDVLLLGSRAGGFERTHRTRPDTETICISLREPARSILIPCRCRLLESSLSRTFE